MKPSIKNFITRSALELGEVFPHQLVDYRVSNVKGVNRLSKTVDLIGRKIIDINKFLNSLDLMPSSEEKTGSRNSLLSLLETCEIQVAAAKEKLHDFMEHNWPKELDFYQKEVLDFIAKKKADGVIFFKGIGVERHIHSDWESESGKICYSIVTALSDFVDKEDIVMPFNIKLSADVDRTGKAVFKASYYVDRQSNGHQFSNAGQLLAVLEHCFKEQVVLEKKDLPRNISVEAIQKTSPKIKEVLLDKNVIKIVFESHFSAADMNRILVKINKLFVDKYGQDFDNNFKIRHKLKDKELDIFLIGEQDINHLFDHMKCIFDVDPATIRSILDAFPDLKLR